MTAGGRYGADPGLGRYIEILATRGIEWGLIGPGEAERLWERHVLNSLAIEPFVGVGASVIDVGSGAGLPGLPLALVRTDVSVVLLEPLLRRSEFLELAVAELGLAGRVTVRRARAEDERGTYDVVTARAVAPLRRLVGWCAPLVGPAGRLVALKGRSAVAEVSAATRELDAAGLTAQVREVLVDGTTEPTWVVVAERGPQRRPDATCGRDAAEDVGKLPGVVSPGCGEGARHSVPPARDVAR